MYLKVYANYMKGLQAMLLTCSVITFLKYIQMSENNMTGRAYMGEVQLLYVIQVVKNIFDKANSYAASDWPPTFLHPGCLFV